MATSWIYSTTFNMWLHCNNILSTCDYIATTYFNMWLHCNNILSTCDYIATTYFNTWLHCNDILQHVITLQQHTFNTWIHCNNILSTCDYTATTYFNMWLHCNDILQRTSKDIVWAEWWKPSWWLRECFCFWKKWTSSGPDTPSVRMSSDPTPASKLAP